MVVRRPRQLAFRQVRVQDHPTGTHGGSLPKPDISGAKYRVQLPRAHFDFAVCPTAHPAWRSGSHCWLKSSLVRTEVGGHGEHTRR
ncbi:hypothetical protein MCOR27_002364 [Pyricularia oryzae]|nr:hypothetical protein MCOR19_006223 [Pyricularia oryzae]KAI6285215.1 hypothetical protein MCOR27_002364 [Pyricularia oryzae]KAI6314650.1 hypothetical protein MCOR29_007314 [Pyricularia oryzae]KAI6320691.1 hypothetical protein MCOR34_002915 [Pyricularia oryzae]KAI6403608.1 hypothetical protein MCOR20_007244 [Pyricularia oryzae]